MRQVSKKQAALLRQRRKVLAQWFAESEDRYLGFTICEVQWDRGCTGRAVDGHEMLRRGQGGSILLRENVLLACRHCHDKAHDSPAEAMARGFITPRNSQP